MWKNRTAVFAALVFAACQGPTADPSHTPDTPASDAVPARTGDLDPAGTDRARTTNPADPAAERSQVFSDCQQCPQMAVIPAGTLELESRPWHLTIAKPFAVGVHEVTFEEWDACVSGGGCGGRIPDDEGWGRGGRPVINVSWDDAVTYTQWLSERTGQEYRLPSEQEWEYAARAGTVTARYWEDAPLSLWEQSAYNPRRPGGSESGQCRHANGMDAAYRASQGLWPWFVFEERSASCDDGYAYTAPVGSFAPNAWGLHDVLGNVREWTAGSLRARRIAGAVVFSCPYLPCGPRVRVLRGGSWYSSPRNLRVDTRSIRSRSLPWDPLEQYPEEVRTSDHGFRVARTILDAH